MARADKKDATPTSLSDAEISANEAETILDNFGDLFQDLFAASNAGTAMDAGDLMVELSVTAERALYGGTEVVEIMDGDCAACTGKPCKICSGRGVIEGRQGFFTIATSCDKCVRGVIRPASCTACRGLGLVSATREVVIPEAIESGHVIVLRGQGALRSDGRETGDLHVRVVIEEIELPRASVHNERPTIFPIAVALGVLLAIGALWTLLF